MYMYSRGNCKPPSDFVIKHSSTIILLLATFHGFFRRVDLHDMGVEFRSDIV